MLKIAKENTKKEKWIIIGLWVIALYQVVGGFAVLSGALISLNPLEIITGSIGLILFVLGIGLIRQKSWALQGSGTMYFFMLLISFFILFDLADKGVSDIKEMGMSLVQMVMSFLFFQLLTSDTAKELYDTDFYRLLQIKKLLVWTFGLGFFGLVFSYGYMMLFVEGVYRGFVIVYGSIFFLGLGLLIGLYKVFKMKREV